MADDFVVNVLVNLKYDSNKKHKVYDDRTNEILNEWCDNQYIENGTWYPTIDDKYSLSYQTGLSLKQINNWFGNKRRRDKRFKSMTKKR